MPTRKLLLLLALVAVLGGSAIWYMETQLPIDDLPFEDPAMRSDEMMDEAVNQNTAADTAASATVSTKQTATTDAPADSSSQTGTQAVANSGVETELSALNNLYDPSYDDSSLNGTFTSEGANTLTDSYDY